MSTLLPRFSESHNFYSDLKSRVNTYFDQHNKKTTGNWTLFSKAIILVGAHIAFYTLALHTKVDSHPYLALTYWAILGLLTAGIGFNIMHDGGHGSFSKYKWLNRVAALTLNVLGGNDYMWHIKHNVIHHGFTNIDGVDDDINIEPLMRMCVSQKKRWFHRFQHIYGALLYSLLHFLWVFFLDYGKYFRKKVAGVPIKRLTGWQHISFWGGKVGNLIVFMVIPILMVGWFDALIGVSVFLAVTGFVISLVFQLAHAVEQTHFPVADQSGKIKNEWAIHQIQTTANFATDNPIVTWFCGGLNFQIEHHLFPKISHVHYPNISKIVRSACAEYGIRYIEYPRMYSAVVSHFRFLKNMGSI